MAKILCVLYDDPITGYPKSSEPVPIHLCLELKA